MHILKAGQVPHTRYVRGSNYNHIGVFADRLRGRAIIISGEPAGVRMSVTHCVAFWC